MSQKPNHFRIGLFVLGGIVLLLAGLFVFGIRSSFEKRHKLVTYVPGDVEGLAIGSPVKLKGVAVGEVTGLHFSWNRYPGTKTPCVIVEFEIKDSVSPVPIVANADFDSVVKQNVAYGLRAIVKSQGITGTSFVELELLDPAKNPPFAYDWPAPRYPYVPSAPTEVGQLLASVKRTRRAGEGGETVVYSLDLVRDARRDMMKVYVTEAGAVERTVVQPISPDYLDLGLDKPRE